MNRSKFLLSSACSIAAFYSAPAAFANVKCETTVTRTDDLVSEFSQTTEHPIDVLDSRCESDLGPAIVQTLSHKVYLTIFKGPDKRHLFLQFNEYEGNQERRVSAAQSDLLNAQNGFGLIHFYNGVDGKPRMLWSKCESQDNR